MEKLASQLPAPYDLMVRFMAYTGLRVAEVAGLDIKDIDLRRRVVTVRQTRTQVRGGWEVHTPKSGKTRQVPVNRVLCEGLKAYLAVHPDPSPDHPLWPGRTGTRTKGVSGSGSVLDYDKPWCRNTFYKKYFKPALKSAGLPEGTRLHDLRHSFASICDSRGIPAKQVAAWMGHANEVVTRTIYIHLFASDSAHYADLLDLPVERSNVVPIRQAP